jgi:hypothetical protein
MSRPHLLFSDEECRQVERYFSIAQEGEASS